ncbi:DUF6443 domain-containing protein [Flavobacterium selenitireducens]|uniref:DUF6443 domain-containing protein n=1 Tax=Flavobacterium selenitireducens TaxID=2722704 RepID=UPI00168BFBBD|nr:type IV secretion protein Rhs [Flavobacterium selenitireducens]
MPTNTTIANPTPEQAKVSVTYFDGLGKPIQEISHRQSASGKDIVNSIRYDDFGRQTKDYLPAPASDATMLFRDSLTVNTALSNYPQYLGDISFFQRRLDASPLGRTLKQGAPGYSWQIGSGHEIKFDYQANLNNEVKLITAISSWDAGLGVFKPMIDEGGANSYPAGRLYKTVTKDENWETGDGLNRTTEEFKDVQGRVILKRRYNLSDPHDTYYVYDQFGNLTYVIPPAVTGTLTQGKLNGQCYQYRYDRRERIAHKKLPGKSWEFMVYDKLDRVVANGPVASPFTNTVRNNNGWLITKYDALDRVVLTGWMAQAADSISWKARQAERDAEMTNFSETKTATTTNTTVNGVAFRYSNVAWPTTTFHVLTVNYYDDYNFPNAPATIPSFVMSDASQAVHYNQTTKPKGLPTGTYARVLEATTAYRREVNHLLYDIYGREVRNHKLNHLGGYTYSDAKLDFAGQLLNQEIQHKYTSSSASNTNVLIKQGHTYTPQGLLAKTLHTVNGNPTESLLKQEYDELGNVLVKRVGGSDLSGLECLQKVEYYHNIRGWLTDINYIGEPSTNLPIFQGNDPDDLFKFQIRYETPSPDNDFLPPTPGEAMYNGNISETQWKTRNDMIQRRYRYFYDDLYRLTDANYEKPGNPTPETNSYNEAVDYDKNGNITLLTRNGEYDDNLYFLEIDNLSYVYDLNKVDRLLKVTDNSSIGSGFYDGNISGNDYGYDAYGNLIIDKNKGIKVITYNHLNLPIGVEKNTSENVIYTYNALGDKVAKSWTSTTGSGNTDYLGIFQYTDGTLDFVSTSEGNLEASLTSSGLIFRYVYNYVDHLGNIRIRYAADSETGEVKILEENNYYPFGLKHNNYNMSRSAYIDGVGVGPCTDCPKSFNYKYNGKEWQDELGINFYDFGFRHYMPDIGRFTTMDPMADFTSYQSPYVVSDNNPVLNMDEDGLGFFNVIVNLLKRLWGAIQSIGNDCSCNKYTQESVRGAWIRPDFPVINEWLSDVFDGGGNKRQTKKESKPVKDRDKLTALDMDGAGLVEGDNSISNVDITIPRFVTPTPRPKIKPVPTLDNKPIEIGKTYNRHIQFAGNSSTLNLPLTERTMRDMLKTLKDFPQVHFMISTSVSVSSGRGATLNSLTTVDGKTGTLGGLMSARANAIYKFLIRRGVKPKQLSIGVGKIKTDGSQPDATFTVTNK